MLYIMTPCSRSENLSLVSGTIPEHAKWVIVLDAKAKRTQYPANSNVIETDLTGHSGNPLRNLFLDSYEFTDDDWVYILDDDNIFHPELSVVMEDLMLTDVGIITWAQEGRLPATDSPREGNIDTACYMFRPSRSGGLRFHMEYGADGVFAHELSKRTTLKMIDQELCYYNYLRK